MNRIFAAILSVVLFALLCWSVFIGAGDIRTWTFLGAGSALGALYAVLGKVPEWIVDHSGGTIHEDDDPSNISPRIYLPILLGAICVAILAFVLTLQFL
ncbi:MAG: hypothetical protein KDB03_02630 [Planctomycetales bacterium]|nr:hypothetical protein [Planctomycetales bacterium]